MRKRITINDPIIRYQTREDLQDLQKAIRATELAIGSLTYGQLVRLGERLEAMAERWRDLEQDAEIIEHDVANPPSVKAGRPKYRGTQFEAD